MGVMDELKYYEVEISGITHVLKLSEADRDQRYPGAKQVDGPDKSAARAAIEKTANATAGEVTVEKIVVSPASSTSVSSPEVAEGTEATSPEVVPGDATVEPEVLPAEPEVTAPERPTRAAAKSNT